MIIQKKIQKKYKKKIESGRQKPSKMFLTLSIMCSIRWPRTRGPRKSQKKYFRFLEIENDLSGKSKQMRDGGFYSTLFFFFLFFALYTEISFMNQERIFHPCTEKSRCLPPSFPRSSPLPSPAPSIPEGKIKIEHIRFRYNRSCQFPIDSNRCWAISCFHLSDHVSRCAIPTEEILPAMVFQVLGAVMLLNVFE